MAVIERVAAYQGCMAVKRGSTVPLYKYTDLPNSVGSLPGIKRKSKMY